MDHLSSCYFCGIALDEPLSTYRLSSADDGSTVTLCPACRRKLDTVLQTVDGPTLDGAERPSPTVTGNADATGESVTTEQSQPPGTGTDTVGTVSDGTVDNDTAGVVADTAAADDTANDEGSTGMETQESDDESADSEETEDVSAATPQDDPVESDDDETDLDEEAIAADIEGDGSPEVKGETEDVEPLEPDTDVDDIRDEMEPDVPDELAGVGENTDDGSDDSDTSDESEATESGDETDDVSAEDVANLAGNVDLDMGDDETSADESATNEGPADEESDELQAAMEPTDFESLAAEADEESSTDAAGGDDGNTDEQQEETDDSQMPSEESDAGDDQEEVDPDVKAADDIATGKKDIEETLEADDELQSEMEPDVPGEFASTNVENGDGTAGDGATAEGDGVQEDDTETDDGAESTDGGTAGEETPRTTVSALEYNKVMRLLQNREFPVQRQEIEEVATSAYDLAESDCAEVIDLAVDRGLIDERDGQLVRPE